jgi:hypothetical protein
MRTQLQLAVALHGQSLAEAVTLAVQQSSPGPNAQTAGETEKVADPAAWLTAKLSPAMVSVQERAVQVGLTSTL